MMLSRVVKECQERTKVDDTRALAQASEECDHLLRLCPGGLDTIRCHGTQEAHQCQHQQRPAPTRKAPGDHGRCRLPDNRHLIPPPSPLWAAYRSTPKYLILR